MGGPPETPSRGPPMPKKMQLNKILLALLVLSCSFLISKKADATVIGSQYDDSALSAVDANWIAYPLVVSSYTGSIGSFTVKGVFPKYNNTTGANSWPFQANDVTIRVYTASNYSGAYSDCTFATNSALSNPYTGLRTFVPYSACAVASGNSIAAFLSEPSSLDDWQFNQNGSGAYFFELDSGSGYTPPVYTTHFSSFTVSTSTNTINIQGYWDGSQGDWLLFYQNSDAYGREKQFSTQATTTGNFNLTVPILITPTPLAASSTYQLLNSYSFYGFLYRNISTSTQAIQLDATSTTYLAGTSTNQFAIQTPRDIAQIPDSECSLTAIGGCIKNAFVWMFYPSSASLTQFSQIDYTSKFPFVYVYQLGQIRNALLTASSTAATSLTIDLWKLPGQTSTTTLTLLSSAMIAAVPFSGTINSIMGWLIWLAMAEYIYYRVIRMHDTNTPS